MKKLLVFSLILVGFSNAFSQNLFISNIDASAFPNVKANFYAFDASWNQQSPDKSEIIIKEHGLTRTVFNVTCSTPIKPLVLSSVLVMDISNSTNGKNIGIAKAAAQAWVNALPTDKSECALTTFNHFNYFNQDFTTDKNKLLTAVNNLSSGYGTDYNKALIDSMCSGLRATKTGKYQKVIVLMTDGLSNSITDVNRIVAEAKIQNCKIFVVTLDLKCPKDLKDISTQTGGQWFENISSDSKAAEIYRTILKIAQGAEPCSVLWRGVANCDTSDVNVDFGWKTTKATGLYPTPPTAVNKVNVNLTSIIFGAIQPGTSKDTTINLSANGVDIKISAINLKYGSTAFSIKNITLPLTIPKNTNYNIPVRFSPSDSNLCYAGFEIVTNVCPASFSCIGGYPDNPIKNSTLKLTHPNGGEVIVTGLDTLITWDGVMPTDTVTLEYSANNGVNWNLITDKAIGLKYIWKNVPKPPSHNCLVRVGKLYNCHIPKIEWQKSFGGSKNEGEFSIQQTKDSGYIFAGNSQSNDGDLTENKGNLDYWVVKVNSNGALEWQKSLGGSGLDEAKSIQQTVDGGYIVAGTTWSNDGDITHSLGGFKDYWIVKLSRSGTLEWQKNFGGSSSEEANSIKQTPDGGYIVAGTTSSSDGDVTYNRGRYDMWIIKLSSSGNIEWQKTYGGSSTEVANDIQLTKDGGYIVIGYNESSDGDCNKNNGYQDYWIVKLNSIGSIEWQKSYGGSKSDQATSIQQTRDGSYIVAGTTLSSDGDVTNNHGEHDYWIIKLGSTGNLEWQKSLGGSLGELAQSINHTIDGGYIVAGWGASVDGDMTVNKGRWDYWIVKLTPLGKLEWQKSFGGNQVDKAYSLQLTKDNGFIVGGLTNSTDGDITEIKGNSDAWIVKLRPESDFIQSDQSNATFSIVEAKAQVYEIDMTKCLVGSTKDSTIVDFIKNAGVYKFRVDSIYFRGADAGAFSLVSTFPKYNVLPNSAHSSELRFAPKRTGIHNAEMVIITQADTLIRNIRGEGIEPQIEIQSEIVDFGKVNLSGHRDKLQVLTINNISDKSISITNTKINGPNLTDFKTIAAVSDFTLQPNEIKKLDLRFQPSDIGRTSGLLEFYYDGDGSPAQVQLYGEGVMGNSQDLASPANDTINVTIDVELKWKPNTAYNSYNLQVSKDENIPQTMSWEDGIYKKDYRLQISETNDFATLNKDTLVSKNNSADVKNLYYWQKYFWRVRNESSDTLGYWSQIWQFKTRMSDMLLMYPENTQTGLEQEINFKWYPVIGAEYYQLQISKNEQFTNMVYSKDSITTTEHFVPDLEKEILYYWRVRVWNTESIGTAYWSEVWTFRTGETGVKDETDVIKIIPNPAGDYITISFESSEGSEVQIYNTLGEMVLAEPIHPMTASHRMNIQSLPKGIYFVKVGGETAKFIKL